MKTSAGLWVSREVPNDQDNLEEVLDDVLAEAESSPQYDQAFGYVVNGMIAVDA